VNLAATGSLATRVEDGHELPLLVWRFAEPMVVAATASVGGGLGLRDWIVNAQVVSTYHRRDQAGHGAELAALVGLRGDGVVMFTAADVPGVRCADDGDVGVEATVGLNHPTWAADADDAVSVPALPGTINIVAQLPVRLSEAALLNALCTATEAKTQALLDAGVPGTGTASDAIAIACVPDGRAEPFAGPRSTWGARLARAVHAAVLAGARAPSGPAPRQVEAR
jgi:adenosylcobinamide amidohydrolase